ncbi:MAG: bifunctional folylpolyglutamate synthase/dihydrofolate synthase [Gammaproteobacteria bacterium]|nr:MAG: bifunctional folylpolyglutamate synthase/dihydrofolate synthase [Gammaproteobacteria bacterium]
MSQSSTLQQWLSWQETLHSKQIDLGLNRVDSVRVALGIPKDLSSTVITIAGTNGKGSTLRLLEEICKAQGLSVGSYTSPHLNEYNERIKLNGNPVSDKMICTAFERIDQCRQEISLSYFEFGTLAALDIFNNHQPDIVLLEVGLGGRLDAVNIIDPDIAVITSIGMDHMDWLGNTLEDIAREKSGIMRGGRYVVSGEMRDIKSIAETAQNIGAKLLQSGKQFEYKQEQNCWSWSNSLGYRNQQNLSMPAMKGEHQFQNAATALMVITLLQEFKFEVSTDAINKGLESYFLPGRLETIQREGVEWIVDVSHNVDGVQRLQQYLQQQICLGKTYAVFGLLQRKQLEQIIKIMDQVIDVWLLTELPDPDSFLKEELLEIVSAEVGLEKSVAAYSGYNELHPLLLKQINPGDRVVLFGSFRMVEAFSKLG